MQIRAAMCTFGLLILTLISLPIAAYGETLTVNCGQTEGLSSVGSALKIVQESGSKEPSTIMVSGDCKENIVIQGIDRLSLIAVDGASITDASNGSLDVIDIIDSQSVSISGFTINGGSVGIQCFEESLCRLKGNTIQGAAIHGVQVMWARAELEGDTIQANADRGLSVILGSSVLTFKTTLKNNGDGIVLNTASHVTASRTTIQDNRRFGAVASNNSTLRCISCTITANSSEGVRVQQSSNASFDVVASSITANGGSGVHLTDLSFAAFSSGTVVTGNGGPKDVFCGPQFSATRGALDVGGGTTNCVEP